MAMTDDDKKFITSRLVIAWGGIFIAALVAGFSGAYVLSRNLASSFANTTNTLYSGTLANGLDTPVVLVGGTITFKAGARVNPQTWSTDSPGQEYHITPNYTVSTIVVKSNVSPDGDGPNAGDSNPGTDKIRVDISTADSWEVDAYATGQPEVLVASLTPVVNSSGATEIHLKRKDLTANANLCLNDAQKRIFYGKISDCSDKQSFDFSKISISINGFPTGTLNCNTVTGAAGQCRIVFRGIYN